MNIMRNWFKLFGIIALVAVIGLSMAACQQEPEATPVVGGTPVITGTAQVGQTLTANIVGVTGAGAPTIQWLRGGAPTGMQGMSFVLTAADLGQVISITVTRAGYDGIVTSAPTAAVAASVVEERPPAAPTLSGNWDLWDGINELRFGGGNWELRYQGAVSALGTFSTSSGNQVTFTMIRLGQEDLHVPQEFRGTFTFIDDTTLVFSGGGLTSIADTDFTNGQWRRLL